MAYIATHNGTEVRIHVEEVGPGRYRIQLGDRLLEVDALEPQRGVMSLLMGDRSLEVDIDAEGEDRFHVVIEGDPYEVEVVEERRKKLAKVRGRAASGRQDLKAPMAGNVRSVLVAPGQRVAQGQVLLILEAMKMQNELKSPVAGTVASLTAREGVAVAAGDPLCVVEPEPA